MMQEIEPLCDRSGRVIYFPVRHHSPTAARLVGQLIRSQRPAIVLIEGPSDYNPLMHELLLGHQPPVAIFSYVARGENDRVSVYYPFCVYSPEWQAIQVAGQCQIPSRFIDLPLAQMPRADTPASNRYADGQLRRSRYIQALSDKLGIDGFDELWDRYIELEPDLTLDEYFRRAHLVCAQIRLLDGQVSGHDAAREAFMAQSVRAALAEYAGQVLVVTGGYHSLGLYQLLTAAAVAAAPAEAEAATPAPDTPSLAEAPIVDRGIALTPYTYARLDSLTGYDAGMPNPGFYHQLWLDTLAGRTDTHRDPHRAGGGQLATAWPADQRRRPDRPGGDRLRAGGAARASPRLAYRLARRDHRGADQGRSDPRGQAPAARRGPRGAAWR
jgi:hypothetical protein